MSPSNLDLRNEGRLSKLETTVEEIRDNHLVHLSQDVKEMSKKLDKVILIVVVMALLGAGASNPQIVQWFLGSL